MKPSGSVMNFSIIALNVHGEGRVSSTKLFEKAVTTSIKADTNSYGSLVFIFVFSIRVNQGHWRTLYYKHTKSIMKSMVNIKRKKNLVSSMCACRFWAILL